MLQIKSQFRALTQVILATTLTLLIHSAKASTELARINTTIITLEEFNRKYQENLKFFPGKAPPKKAVLDDLIRRELGIQEAKKQSIDKSPEVAERLNTVLFNSFVEKNLKQEIEALRVTDQEAKEFYQTAPLIRTSHILVALPPHPNSEDETKALERVKIIQAKLKSGKTLSEVAQSDSDGPSAALGGDIDFQSKERLDPLYYETALGLKKPGQVSPAIRTSFGFQIIQLTAIKPWKDVDPSQFKRTLLEQKKARIFQAYMSQLRAKAKVTTHPELLND